MTTPQTPERRMCLTCLEPLIDGQCPYQGEHDEIDAEAADLAALRAALSEAKKWQPLAEMTQRTLDAERALLSEAKAENERLRAECVRQERIIQNATAERDRMAKLLQNKGDRCEELKSICDRLESERDAAVRERDAQRERGDRAAGCAARLTLDLDEAKAALKVRRTERVYPEDYAVLRGERNLYRSQLDESRAAHAEVQSQRNEAMLGWERAKAAHAEAERKLESWKLAFSEELAAAKSTLASTQRQLEEARREAEQFKVAATAHELEAAKHIRERDEARATIHKIADALGRVSWGDDGRYLQATDEEVLARIEEIASENQRLADEAFDEREACATLADEHHCADNWCGEKIGEAIRARTPSEEKR